MSTPSGSPGGGAHHPHTQAHTQTYTRRERNGSQGAAQPEGTGIPRQPKKPLGFLK